MRRAPREIVREAVEWNVRSNAGQFADTVMHRLAEEGWHLVSVPVTTVCPVDEPRGFAEGLEEVWIEGLVDGSLINSRQRFFGSVPDAQVRSATAHAARGYLRELGQFLGLPL